ncbi:hypothetical protein FVO59_14165 [Microbacterium esteraromaticum]|uniref:Uncharacterized protein n=1 Tax=Microbacterium esteraromaticum TaxID=57043 RepID=A0A7D8AF73_9MICO|nr:hypothetical protein [Microbacterium esteraromaticum]QMU98204.1 hypothetical protein FVO59_14165 [Microbacterium esteraromaticum]
MLVPLGTIGAVLATVSVVLTCGIVAAGRDEVGLPVAGWLVGTLLSLAAGFSDLRPTLFSIAGGVTMAVFIVVALLIRRNGLRRVVRGH